MLTIARKDWVDGDVVHKNDIWYDKSSKSFAMCEGIEAMKQVLEAVVKTVRGEIQVDLDRGVPYFQTVFQTTRFADAWATSVQEEVGRLGFVRQIESFDYEILDAEVEGRKKIFYKLVVSVTDGTTVETSSVV